MVRRPYYLRWCGIGAVAIAILGGVSLVWWNSPERRVRTLVEEQIERPGFDSWNWRGRSLEAIDDELRSLGARAVPPLLVLLNEGDGRTRRVAAANLGTLRATSAAGALVAQLGDPEFLVRESCATALGEVGQRDAVAPLIGCLADEHDVVRAAAAEALGKLESPAAVDSLMPMVGDPSLRVRLRAVEALGRLGQSKATSVLLDALQHDTLVEREAAVALARLGRREGVPQLVIALKALGAPDDRSRVEVVKVIAKLRDPRTKEALEWVAASEFSSADLKYQAVEALNLLNGGGLPTTRKRLAP